MRSLRNLYPHEIKAKGLKIGKNREAFFRSEAATSRLDGRNKGCLGVVKSIACVSTTFVVFS